MTAQKIRLPHLETLWKWPRLVNPHLAEIEQDCLAWSASFGAFDAKTHRFIHEKGKLNLLAGMCYAPMKRTQLRTGCDLMHLFFMFDEHSDQSGPDEVWHQARVQVDAFCHPHKARPQCEWIGGEFARQFWLRIPEAATETFRRRFLLTWIDYVESVARQAEYRSKSHILDLDRYFNLRRHTSGAPSTIALYEMDMNIPDDVRENVIIRELETLAVDLIVIVNDLVSYNKEQAVGDDEHNIVTVIMKQFRLGIQEAIDKAGELSDLKIERFYTLLKQIPGDLGPVDRDLQNLVNGMAQCVSGVMHWSYESHRYFGAGGLDVKRTRVVHLLPKLKKSGSVRPIAVDGIGI